MALKNLERDRIIKALVIDRQTIESVARALDFSKNTILKVRQELIEAGFEILCKCGLPSDHKGICALRRKDGHGVNKWGNKGKPKEEPPMEVDGQTKDFANENLGSPPRGPSFGRPAKPARLAPRPLLPARSLSRRDRDLTSQAPNRNAELDAINSFLQTRGATVIPAERSPEFAKINTSLEYDPKTRKLVRRS